MTNTILGAAKELPLLVYFNSERDIPRGDPEIREVIVRPYRVVYRRRANEVEIATVFRASRLLPDIE